MIIVEKKDSEIKREIEVNKVKYYCPGCGRRHCYVAKGEGDFYEGPEHYCITCGFTFTMPCGGKSGFNYSLKIELKPE